VNRQGNVRELSGKFTLSGWCSPWKASDVWRPCLKQHYTNDKLQRHLTEKAFISNVMCSFLFRSGLTILDMCRWLRTWTWSTTCCSEPVCHMTLTQRLLGFLLPTIRWTGLIFRWPDIYCMLTFHVLFCTCHSYFNC